MKTRQVIENAELDRHAKQSTDAANAEQTMKSLRARSAEQHISGQQQLLKLGKYSAQGKVAVFCLLIVVIAYLVFRFLSKS